METASFAATVRAALIEELEQLHKEVRDVAGTLSDELLWRRPLQPSNSVGHLMLHLTGNLNHFVGAQLGHTGYVREREREFTEAQPPPRDVLLAHFADAVGTFRRVVGGLTPEQMVAPHPHEPFGTVTKALVHLVAHFALHRGQISYIVRLVNPRQ